MKRGAVLLPFALFVKHPKLNHFNLGGRLLGDFEFPMPDLYRFVEFGEVLKLVQNESAYGQVFIAFRQIEVEQLIGLGYFQASLELVLARCCLTCRVVFAVVFVLNFSENLFHQVFHRHNAACAAKLIDNDGK